VILSPYFLNFTSFLLVMLLAAAVVGTAAWLHGLTVSESVSQGSALFLIQLFVFVALAGLGTAMHVSQIGASAVGVIAVLCSTRTTQHPAEDQRERS
jgi:hypothetical protein